VGRTLVIGDLHGCFDEAMELLDRAAVTSSDRVIFTGDLIDRGPKRRECVELAMKHQSVLGNHEERVLQLRYAPGFALNADHRATRDALGPEHLAYFQTLPLFIRLPEFQAAVVHAGAFPGVPLESQDRYHLLHAQCLRPPRRKSWWPSKAPPDATFWSQLWRGPERLIFGHTVLDRPLVSPFAVGVDTGAVHGRMLTALILPDWTTISIPARRKYMGGHDTGVFPIHGGVNAFS
jgi:diadenosine tetraphosphatase ApaH/serine/threonine PP2A family protein phosphatase